MNKETETHLLDLYGEVPSIKDWASAARLYETYHREVEGHTGPTLFRHLSTEEKRAWMKAWLAVKNLPWPDTVSQLFIPREYPDAEVRNMLKKVAKDQETQNLRRTVNYVILATAWVAAVCWSVVVLVLKVYHLIP